MSGAYSIATGKRYGLQRVCRIWQVPRSTVYAHRHRSDGEGSIDAHSPKKRGPMGPCSDPVLVKHLRQVLAESPFHGEGYRKVWAKLRFAGLRTSKERVRSPDARATACRHLRAWGIRTAPKPTTVRLSPSSPT